MSRVRDYEYYSYLPPKTVSKFEPDMRRLRVSKVARSSRGFLTYYKRVGGNEKEVNDYWDRRRAGFIARHLVQYEKNPTYRRRLALIAWAYDPE